MAMNPIGMYSDPGHQGDPGGRGRFYVVAKALTADGPGFLAARAHPGPVAFPVDGPGWLPAIAVDGKVVRGAAGEDGVIPHLLAAVTHGTGTVLAERAIGGKGSEVPELALLLREMDGHYLLAGTSSPPTHSTPSGPTPGSFARSSSPTTSSPSRRTRPRCSWSWTPWTGSPC